MSFYISQCNISYAKLYRTIHFFEMEFYTFHNSSMITKPEVNQ